jgi:uncharacterized membrane protein
LEDIRKLEEQKRKILEGGVNRRQRKTLMIIVFWILVLVWIIGGFSGWLHVIGHIVIVVALFVMLTIVGSMSVGPKRPR